MTSKPRGIAEPLIEALRRLRATGAAGFEGLVARLLTALTGRTFRLAAAGTQGGEDLSARPRGELVVAVECKRFGERRQFDAADLSYKMDAAWEQDGQLDLWMLAASRLVPTQLHRQLSRHGDRLGVFVEFLDHDPQGLGPLPVLCARYPEITLPALPVETASQIESLLEEIRRAPRFQAVLDEFSGVLSPSDLGYAAAHAALSKRFAVAVADPTASLEEFGQRLLPRAPGAHDLPRDAVDTALDGWWRCWPAGGRILVLHGEEGTGKSWNLASWLARRILRRDSAPMLVWCGSDHFEDSSLLELGARLLERRLPPAAPRAQLERRLSRWGAATEPPGAAPRVLFVVDGLNERPQGAAWQRWLMAARRELAERLGGAALVVTCRTSTWVGLRMAIRGDADAAARLATAGAAARPEARRQVVEVQVEDFTDPELDQMFAICGLARPALDPALRQLLRRPRYFQLAVLHWARYASSGDFTVPRLFFEEWRDRMESRLDGPLPDEEFQRLLRDTAREFRDGVFGRHDLARLLAGNPEIGRALEELISAGVFVPVAGARGSFRLESNRLYLALGLLLVKRLSEAAGTLEQVMEAAAGEVEAGGGADDASRIVAYAACIALTASGPAAPPRNAVQALLLTLARQPNGADAWEKAQPWMYYPSAPDIFQDLAEAEWSREHADYRARERIGYAFAWIAEKWPANEVLTATCRQWLRFVHPDGIREGIGGRPRLDAEPELRARIAAVQPLTEEHGIAPVPVVAANLLGLADLALLAMCEVCLNGGPRELHLPALAAWAVSNAVMGRMRNGEEARWVVRFGGEGFWPGLTDFAAIFAAQGEPILHRAAALLLRLEGSTDAWERARQLDPPMPAAPVPAEPNQDDAGRELSLLEAAWAAGRLADRALDPQLPLDALRWRYQDLLRLIDLAEVSTGRQRTSSDLALEQADAALSRTAPHAYASFARRVVDFILGQVESRTDLRTEILAKHFLILSRRQLARARTLLPGLERERQSRPDAMGGAVWDLAEVVLAALPAGPSQLRFLLGRLDTADAADWEDLLAPLPPPAVRSMLRRLSRASGVQRRRMLYFPWREAPALSALERQALTAAACDPEMGTVAGSVPQHARDPELLLTAVRNGWVDDERLSRILAQQPWARVALAAAPPEVQLHLGVEAASWAVCERGLEGAAVRQWTGDLDRALWHPPAQQAISAGGRIAVETVTAAMRRAPELTDAWIAALTGQTDLSMRLTNIHFSLASALLLALLNNDDDRAVAAFSRLLHPQAFVFTVTDQPSGLPSVWFLPFKERDTAATRQVARLLFDQAFTDDALSRLAYAASLHGRLDALVDQLEPPPTPDNTLAEARVVALLALAPLSARAERAIERFAANATGWRPDVVAWARTQLRQDSRARQWFRRFLEDPSTVQAWAAFRLFLHTVDRRGLLWLGDELERAKGTPGYEARRRHLILNRSQVGRAIKAQADQAAKHLCGHPVPFDIVPWKRGWRL